MENNNNTKQSTITEKQIKSLISEIQNQLILLNNKIQTNQARTLRNKRIIKNNIKQIQLIFNKATSISNHNPDDIS